MKVLAFGEVLWDVYTNSEHLGGASMNFAAHFKKCGGESWIATAVGDDNMGKKAVFEKTATTYWQGTFCLCLYTAIRCRGGNKRSYYL